MPKPPYFEHLSSGAEAAKEEAARVKNSAIRRPKNIEGRKTL